MPILCVWVFVCVVDSSIDISRTKMYYILSDILGRDKHYFESHFTKQLEDIERLN